MTKLEAIKHMCDGKIAEKNGDFFRIDANGLIGWWGKMQEKWNEGYTAFVTAANSTWTIVEEPIDGHDWNWAMSKCDIDSNVRWYEWEEDEILHRSIHGDYRRIKISINGYGDELEFRMEKKYFAKKGWIKA